MNGLEQARERALRYLSHRDRTRWEVEQKLTQEGFDPDTVRGVMATLEEYRYVDDARYATAYLRERLDYGGRGLAQIRRELQGKGIDPILLEETLQGANELDAAVKTLTVKWRGIAAASATIGTGQRKKAVDFLLRRGFSVETAREALKRYDVPMQDWE
ncbi:MAG: recombination regulator RecX [Clostridiales bacterium]|jgi:regulatory protein|nr:recombination regulator RecX [Clostridiales bacterium]